MPIMKNKPLILISDRLIAILELVIKVYFTDLCPKYFQPCRRYVKYLNNLTLSIGKREALKHNKSVRLSFTRFLAGAPITDNSLRLKRDKTGFPVILSDFKGLVVEKETRGIRLLMTLLTVTRAVVLSPEPSYKSIEHLWVGNLPFDWYTHRTVVLRTLGVGKRDIK